MHIFGPFVNFVKYIRSDMVLVQKRIGLNGVFLSIFWNSPCKFRINFTKYYNDFIYFVH